MQGCPLHLRRFSVENGSSVSLRPYSPRTVRNQRPGPRPMQVDACNVQKIPGTLVDLSGRVHSTKRPWSSVCAAGHMYGVRHALYTAVYLDIGPQRPLVDEARRQSLLGGGEIRPERLPIRMGGYGNRSAVDTEGAVYLGGGSPCTSKGDRRFFQNKTRWISRRVPGPTSRRGRSNPLSR